MEVKAQSQMYSIITKTVIIEIHSLWNSQGHPPKGHKALSYLQCLININSFVKKKRNFELFFYLLTYLYTSQFVRPI